MRILPTTLKRLFVIKRLQSVGKFFAQKIEHLFYENFFSQKTWSQNLVLNFNGIFSINRTGSVHNINQRLKQTYSVDTSFYLHAFQQAADKIDKKLLAKKHLETAVVMYGHDCVVLKLYKRSWANPLQDPLTAESRIFFSIWISDASIKEQKLLYNIHALKLRKLKNHSIQSRKFADSFRQSFKPFEPAWKNVRIDCGPLTLMEGWVPIAVVHVEEDLLKLAQNFLTIAHLIDDTLAQFTSIKKPGTQHFFANIAEPTNSITLMHKQ